MSELLPFVVIGLVSGSVYALAAMGLVLTYKTSGIFNFAQGTIAAAVAFAFYELRDRQGLPWPLALIVCVFVLSPVMGLGLERLARRVSEVSVASKVVATLGLLVGVQQLAIIRYGAEARPFAPFLPTKRIRIASVNVEVGQLIIVAIALAAAIGLSQFFRRTGLGRAMRAVVDDPSLLALTGQSPIRVRRWAWSIGSAFAGMSGILLAPTIGLDAGVLTFLVVQAFGAAAVGMFTSLPLTYAGGILVGVAASISTKYIGNVTWLAGLPPSLPFLVLFVALVAIPSRRFIHIGIERPRPPVPTLDIPRQARRTGYAIGAALVCAVPLFAGPRLIIFTSAAVYVVIFISLAFLERTSGQVSLAQLGFAAVGAAAFSHFASAGIPWPVAVLLSALVAVPVGALVAIPAVRLSGLYLALATFGFGLLLERLAFPLGFMFGGGDSVVTPRPSFARSDTGYYFVVVALVAVAATVVGLVRRSRLGRLLRAMADSPLAVTTGGTSTSLLKLAAFCLSAFLAGLGGALLGPVTSRAAPVAFGVFPSLLLVVVLALQGHVGELRASIGAAVALTVVPAYVDDPNLTQWLPVLFGIAAIAVAVREGRENRVSLRELALVAARRRGMRSPVGARVNRLVAARAAP